MAVPRDADTAPRCARRWLSIWYGVTVPAVGAGGCKGGLSPARLRRVLDHIDGHLGDGIRLTQLAAVTGLSPAHFCSAVPPEHRPSAASLPAAAESRARQEAGLGRPACRWRRSATRWASRAKPTSPPRSESWSARRPGRTVTGFPNSAARFPRNRETRRQIAKDPRGPPPPQWPKATSARWRCRLQPDCSSNLIGESRPCRPRCSRFSRCA